jgi:hypothetical protein
LDVAIAHATHAYNARECKRRDLLLAELIQQEEEHFFKSKSTCKSTLLLVGEYALAVAFQRYLGGARYTYIKHPVAAIRIPLTLSMREHGRGQYTTFLVRFSSFDYSSNGAPCLGSIRRLEQRVIQSYSFKSSYETEVTTTYRFEL